MENILKIAITQGDGNGVGLELALKTFAQEEMFEFCIPILYANEKLLLFHRKTLGLGNVPYTLVSTPDEAEAGRLNLIATVRSKSFVVQQPVLYLHGLCRKCYMEQIRKVKQTK